MARDMGQPEASAIWRRAIVLDGSAEGQKAALLALQGIRGAKSVATVDAVIEQFEATIDNPSKDKGDNAGFMRLEYAKTLGALGDAKAVPVLVKALGKTKDEQPVAVHKEATTALEMIGDPSAVDALLTCLLYTSDAADE